MVNQGAIPGDGRQVSHIGPYVTWKTLDFHPQL